MNYLGKIVIIEAFIIISGCKGGSDSFSKDQIEEKSLKPSTIAPAAKSVEIPDLFSASRTHVQTGGMISLSLKSNDTDDIRELSLTNLTTQLTIFENQRVGSGLTEPAASGEEIALALGKTEIIVKIYPGLPDINSKMKYGENELQLTATAASGNRFQKQKTYLKDFKYFAASFSANVNPSESRSLHGGMGTIANTISSSTTGRGTTYLITDTIPILVH